MLELVFRSPWHYDVGRGLTVGAIFGAIVGTVSFLSSYSGLIKATRLDALSREFPMAAASTSGLTEVRGFLAMEYWALVLNRSYIVFIAADGLYGYKFSGPVDNSNPKFFEPYGDLLDDPNYLGSVISLREMAKGPGNFFIPSSEISGVEMSYKPKWGMSNIRHSGRVTVESINGGREFILLGSVDAQKIQNVIVDRMGLMSAK
jgi:hypothetical protein